MFYCTGFFAIISQWHFCFSFLYQKPWPRRPMRPQSKPPHTTEVVQKVPGGYMKHYHKSLIVQLLLFTPFIIFYMYNIFCYWQMTKHEEEQVKKKHFSSAKYFLNHVICKILWYSIVLTKYYCIFHIYFIVQCTFGTFLNLDNNFQYYWPYIKVWIEKKVH